LKTDIRISEAIEMRTSIRIATSIACSLVCAQEALLCDASAAPLTSGIRQKAWGVLLPRGGADDGGSSGSNPIMDILKSAGIDIDPSSLSEEDAGAMGKLLAKLAEAGKSGTPPDPETSLKLMQEVMKSSVFQTYMQDPEKLEKSRLAIFNNPLMKGMMGSMPGFEDILNDPEKWRETMTAAYEMMVNMSPEELGMMAKMMAAAQQGGGPGGPTAGMMGGGGGDFGMGGGLGSLGDLPGTATSSSITSALDDLSEEDDE